MIGYVLLHVTYMLIFCHVLTSLYVRLHSCRFDYIYMYASLIWHYLCMLMVACGNVYDGIMVVVMHKVIACIVDMALH